MRSINQTVCRCLLPNEKGLISVFLFFFFPMLVPNTCSDGEQLAVALSWGDRALVAGRRKHFKELALSWVYYCEHLLPNYEIGQQPPSSQKLLIFLRQLARGLYLISPKWATVIRTTSGMKPMQQPVCLVQHDPPNIHNKALRATVAPHCLELVIITVTHLQSGYSEAIARLKWAPWKCPYSYNALFELHDGHVHY